MHGVREMRGGPERVVSATGDGKQSKSSQQTKGTAHAVPIVALAYECPISEEMGHLFLVVLRGG
jgi:hypothetical protein